MLYFSQYGVFYNMSNKSIYTDKLSKIETTEHCLETLKELVGYPGSLQAFRVLCWRHNIPFEKSFRGDNKRLKHLLIQGVDFSKHTLQEIKQMLDYTGGLDGLLTFLKRHNVEFKHTNSFKSDNKDKILIAIKALGDTSNLTPREIIKQVGYDIVNPTQFLRRNGISYKQKS